MKKIVISTIIIILLSVFLVWIGRMINLHDTTMNSHYPMPVDTINQLIIYNITDCRMDLACGEMPSSMNEDVILCVAAAFTGKCLDYFDHDNILGPHISNGILYQGYSEVKDGIAFNDRYALFVWHGLENNGEMMPKKIHQLPNEQLLLDAMKQGGMAFTQHWVIKDGMPFLPTIQPLQRIEYFRSLCIKQNKVYIIANNEEMSYETYIDSLISYGVENALYMDMGEGWNHSFYRDAMNQLHILHPRTHSYPTNWIVIYRN